MLPLPHRYRVQLKGEPTGYAQLSAAGVPALVSAAPKEFDGPGDAWSPEYLLLAAVSSCFLLTLRTVAKAAKFEFVALDCACDGVVDKQDHSLRFTTINLYPQLVIHSELDREKALRILDKSKSACLVSQSLSTPVRMEATLIIAE